MQQEQIVPPRARLGKAFETLGLARARVAKWIDSFWGYDVFIAHRRADAAEYAFALHEELKQHRISSFIDRVVYGAGDSLIVATRRHVAKSTVFVLVASPELLVVRWPTDWVREEVAIYLATHAEDPKLIVLDFGDIVGRAVAAEVALPHSIIGQVEPFLRLSGDLGAISARPTAAVVEVIHRQLDGRRRDRSRLRLFQRVAATLAILLVCAIGLGIVAVGQRNLAERRLAETLRVDSRRLAVESRRQLEAGRADVAVLLAREALAAPAAKSAQSVRPYTAEAALALTRALAYRPLATTVLSFGGSVQALAQSPDGRLLFLSPGAGRAQLVDIATRTRLGDWMAHKDTIHAAAFNPGGGMLATASHDRSVRLWQLDNRSQIAELSHSAPVRTVAFSPNGARLVTGDDDGNVRLWNAKAPHQNIGTMSCAAQRKKDTDDVVVGAVAYNPDGQSVAVGCGNVGVFLWTSSTSPRSVLGVDASVTSLAFSPDGTILVVGYKSGLLQGWNPNTGSALWGFGAHEARITSLAFSKDGAVIATASDDKTALLLEAMSGRRLQTLLGHTFYVMNTLIAHNGSEAITGSWDNTVRFWQTANSAVGFVVTAGEGGVTSTVFSPHGDNIAVGSWEGGLSIVASDTGALLKTLRPKGSVQSLAYSPDGHIVATASVDDLFENGVITLWDVASGNSLHMFPADQPITASAGRYVAFSPDGAELVVAGGDGTVNVLDVGSKAVTEVMKIEDKEVLAVAYSKNGQKLLALNSGNRLTVLDRTLKKSIDIAVREERATTAGFDAAGDRIVVAGAEGETGVYDARSGQRLGSLPSQNASVNDVEFSPDGMAIVTATADGYVTLWEVERGEPLDSYFLFDPRREKANPHRKGDREIVSARFSPDGKSVVVGCSDGTIRIWRPVGSTFSSTLSGALKNRRLTSRERTEFGLAEGR